MNIGSEGKGQALKTLRWAVAIAIGALPIALGFGQSAHAFPLNCFPSSATVPQGGTFTVSGETSGPGEFVRVLLDGAVEIGSGTSGVGAAPFLFNITATIPPTTSANVVHALATRSGGVTTACNTGILVLQAATPTAAPTAAPTATPGDDLRDLIRALADRDGRGGQQQQQQQQAIPIPVGFSGGGGGGGRSLPKTGADVAEVGGIGTATLVAGVTLMEFARRRRRHWLARVDAPAATIERSVPASVPPMPARAGETEGDLLLPYTAASPSPPSIQNDFVTPSF